MLCQEVHAATVLSLLVVADRHDANELKSTCVKVSFELEIRIEDQFNLLSCTVNYLDFQVVVERSQEVVRQPGWRDVLKVVMMIVMIEMMLMVIVIMMVGMMLKVIVIIMSGWRDVLRLHFPPCFYNLHLYSKPASMCESHQLGVK